MFVKNSEETENRENMLLESILSVAQGASRIETLAVPLADATAKIEEIRKNFDNFLSRQSSKVRNASSEIVCEVNRYFEEYQWIINETSHHLQNNNLDGLAECADKISVCVDNLNHALMEFYQVVFVAVGPTKVPGINQILSLLKQNPMNKEVMDYLIMVVDEEKNNSQRMLRDIDRGVLFDADPVKLKEACQSYYGNLQEFDGFFESGKTEILDKIKNDLIKTANLFRLSDNSMKIAELTAFPTASPIANALINSARRAKNGKMALSEFAKFFMDQKAQFDDLQIFYAQMIKDTYEKEVEAKEMDFIGDTLASFDESLHLYADMLDSGDFKRIDEAEKKLKSSILRMNKSRAILNAVEASRDKVVCQCGHRNPFFNRNCEKCNAPLPVLNMSQNLSLNVMEDGAFSPVSLHDASMTENVTKLFDAADGVLKGTLDVSELDRVLSRMERLLDESYRTSDAAIARIEKYANVNIESEKIKNQELMGITEDFLEGLDDFSDGLAHFRDFLESGVSESLRLGKESIWRSVGKLQNLE